MKIGLVCPYSVARGGGVQEVVYALAKHLRRRGHTVRVVTPRPPDFTATKRDFIFIGDGRDMTVSVLRTTGQVSGAPSQQIVAILDQEKFDVLHFHEPWVPFLGAQILQANQRAVRRAWTVGTFHAKLPDNIGAKTLARLTRFYTKPLLRYLDALTAVSPAAAEHATSLTRRPLVIIPNGIDLQLFRYRKPVATDRAADPTILFVGRLEPRKGVSYLVKAFELVRRDLPTARLLIAGDGVDRPKLEKLVRDLAVRGVEFLGRPDDTTKRQLLTECTVFCSPALYGESFGIVILEAMASGAPMVAGNNPGYAAVLTGQGATSLVDPRDPAQLAARLKQFLTDDKLRADWQRWAAHEIGRYDYETVTQQYEAVYDAARSS
jgi:phosphatidylinositol alpha-mannosyltransferase